MYQNIDLFFTPDGDYKIGSSGDLVDTRNDLYRSLVQEISTLVSANLGEWALYPNIGANTSELIGTPNNAITSEMLKQKVEDALGPLLPRREDFEATIIPISENTLGILLTVQIGLENGEPQALTIPLAFNIGVGIFTS